MVFIISYSPFFSFFLSLIGMLRARNPETLKINFQITLYDSTKYKLTTIPLRLYFV